MRRPKKTNNKTKASSSPSTIPHKYSTKCSTSLTPKNQPDNNLTLLYSTKNNSNEKFSKPLVHNFRFTNLVTKSLSLNQESKKIL